MNGKHRRLLALILAAAMVLPTAAAAAEPEVQTQVAPETVQMEKETTTEAMFPEPEEAPAPQLETLSEELPTGTGGASLLSVTRTPIDITGVESEHNYTNNTDQFWAVSCPGAERIELTFDSRTKFDYWNDYLTIMDSSGKQVGRYSSTELAGQTVTVPGEKAVLRLTSDVYNTYWGFKVTEAYAEGNWAYSATVTPPEHGTLAAFPMDYDAGETLTVYANPDAGYKLSTIYVDGTAIEGNTFIAATDHIISAEFEECRSGVTIADSGTCGDHLNWYLYEDGQLWITGTGDMQNYGWNGAPWYSDRNSIKSVVLTEGVTSVGSSAFQECRSLTTVEIPQGVTSIGDVAFSRCSSLTAVKLPAGVTSIGNDAFSWCGRLTSVELPQGMTTIGNDAFLDCSSMTSVVIPESVTSIGDRAFCQCSNLISVIIPAGVTSIGDETFSNCSKLASVIIPQSVTSIGNNTFSNCHSLTTVEIPTSVTSIGEHAFTSCWNLTSVVLPSGLITIGNEAFSRCSRLGFAEFLGNAPEQLGTNVFPSQTPGDFAIYYHEGNTGWTSPIWNGYPCYCAEVIVDEYSILNEENRNSQQILFTLNEEAKTAVVGDNSTTDRNCGYDGSQRGVVTLPDSVTKNGISYRVIGIGQNAFSNCNLLKTIHIGQYVSSVDHTAFQNCSNFSGVTVSEASQNYSAVDGVLYDWGKYYLYLYPSGKADTTFTVPDTVQTIGRAAFATSRYLKELTVPNTVLEILVDAFDNCTALEKITLPFLGNSAGDSLSFDVVCDGESRPTTVVLTGESQLCSGAFRGESHVETIVLPTCPAAIPEYCFYNCSSLHTLQFADQPAVKPGELILPEGNHTIERSAFYGCSSLKSLELKNGDYDIEGVFFNSYGDRYGNGAFEGCSSLTQVTIGQGNGTIGNSAFYNCSALKNLELKGGNYQIGGIFADQHGSNQGHGAFESCTSLTQITIGEGNGTIGNSTFSNCNVLKSLELKGGNYNICEYAFSGNTALTTVIIGPGDGTIGQHAFLNCTALSSLTIPEGTTSIGQGAFYDCSALPEVVLPSSLTDLGLEAFAYCTAVRSFTVAPENPNYCNDKWDVLFNKDKTELINYPAGRIWPYYNVPEETTTIGRNAFFGCSSLVNLYLPATVSTLNWGAISNCPGTTLCVYRDSPAHKYAASNNLQFWYMDNYKLQNIQIEGLPEGGVIPMGQDPNAYVTQFGGKSLQVDDYQVSYSTENSGVQLMTVTYEGKTATAEILRYDPEKETVLTVSGVSVPDGGQVMLAAYDKDGRMLSVQKTLVTDGQASGVLSNEQYAQMDHAKVFRMDQANSPVGECLPVNK